MTNKERNAFDLSKQLSSLVHEIFLELKYRPLLDSLQSYHHDHWYSVIVEMDKVGCPLEDLLFLGEETYSKFVFRCIPSPNWSKNKELMVLFTVANSQWTSIINFEQKSLN